VLVVFMVQAPSERDRYWALLRNIVYAAMIE
jgi:hypothetical protein